MTTNSTNRDSDVFTNVFSAVLKIYSAEWSPKSNYILIIGMGSIPGRLHRCINAIYRSINRQDKRPQVHRPQMLFLHFQTRSAIQRKTNLLFQVHWFVKPVHHVRRQTNRPRRTGLHGHIRQPFGGELFYRSYQIFRIAVIHIHVVHKFMYNTTDSHECSQLACRIARHHHVLWHIMCSPKSFS